MVKKKSNIKRNSFITILVLLLVGITWYSVVESSYYFQELDRVDETIGLDYVSFFQTFSSPEEAINVTVVMSGILPLDTTIQYITPTSNAYYKEISVGSGWNFYGYSPNIELSYLSADLYEMGLDYFWMENNGGQSAFLCREGVSGATIIAENPEFVGQTIMCQYPEDTNVRLDSRGNTLPLGYDNPSGRIRIVHAKPFTINLNNQTNFTLEFRIKFNYPLDLPTDTSTFDFFIIEYGYEDGYEGRDYYRFNESGDEQCEAIFMMPDERQDDDFSTEAECMGYNNLEEPVQSSGGGGSSYSVIVEDIISDENNITENSANEKFYTPITGAVVSSYDTALENPVYTGGGILALAGLIGFFARKRGWF